MKEKPKNTFGNYPLFVYTLFALNLPKPIQEFKFLEDRKFRFDYAWPEQKIAVEIEGGIFIKGAHGSISGIKRDIEKYNLATLNGWKVLRILPEEIEKSKTYDIIKLMFERVQG